MLSLLIFGGRISLIVGFAAAFVAMVIGGGGRHRRRLLRRETDAALMRITDYFLVIPDLPSMIVLCRVRGPGLHIIFVIGLLLWTTTARIVRAQVKSVRERVTSNARRRRRRATADPLPPRPPAGRARC